MLHAKINKSQVYIIMLHVDIINLAYRGQNYAIILSSPQDVVSKFMCSNSRTYIQCAFKRQCTITALVAITQLLYLNCFRLETHTINITLLIYTTSLIDRLNNVICTCRHITTI